jgi:hypothetical protein
LERKTLTGLALAAALACLAPIPPAAAGPPPTSPAIRSQPALSLWASDLYFVKAQEESLMGFLPAPRRLDDGVPMAVAQVIRRLDSTKADSRERAMDELRRACREDIRWLFWGAQHHDPEVRRRCAIILGDLVLCRNCGGSGQCDEWISPDGVQDWGRCRVCLRYLSLHHPGIPYPCRSCDGTGLRKPDWAVCRSCAGSGLRDSRLCSGCGGTGLPLLGSAD